MKIISMIVAQFILTMSLIVEKTVECNLECNPIQKFLFEFVKSLPVIGEN